MRTTAVFALLTFLTTAALGAEQVIIRADVWYPHNGEPNAAARGYMIEIADELFKAKGIAVNYDLMPWERALAMTRNGEIDCVVGAAHGDAPDFVFPSEPLGSDQSFAFVKKGNPWRYAGIESLGNVKIGVIEGYSYNEEADDYIKRNKNTPKVQSVTGDTPLEQNLRKLAAGRIDAVLESRPVFLATAERLGLRDKFQDAGAVGEPNDLFIACSPKRESSKRFTRILSEGVPALRASGKLKTILSKYGLQDWK